MKFLNDLKPKLTSEQYIAVGKSMISAHESFMKIYNKYQRSKKKYET